MTNFLKKIYKKLTEVPKDTLIGSKKEIGGVMMECTNYRFIQRAPWPSPACRELQYTFIDQQGNIKHIWVAD